jgi:hypothetical protein
VTVASKRDGLIACCAVSAGVHAALVPEHLREHLGAGFGFIAGTGALVAVIVGLTARPESAAAASCAVLVLLGLVLAYAVASTSGIPLVHPEVDPVDTVGVLTKGVELLGLWLAAHVRAPVKGRAIPVSLAGLIAVFSALVTLSLSGHHQMPGM